MYRSFREKSTSNKDINPTIKDVNKMVDRLLDKNKSIEQDLAKLENQIADCKDDLVKIDDGLVNTINEIKKVKDYIADQIIQSIGKKPELRWWHRLGDEISRTMDKSFMNYVMIAFIIFSSISIITIFFEKLSIIQGSLGNQLFEVLIRLFSVILIIVIILSVYQEVYICLRNVTLIKIKRLVKDLMHFTRFLLTIFICDIIIFSIIELFFYKLHQIYKFLKIFESNFFINTLTTLIHYMFIQNLVWGMLVVAILYYMIFNKIMINSIRRTLKIFDDKWEYYKSYMMLQYIFVFSGFFIILKIPYLNSNMEQELGVVDIILFVIIYFFSLVEFIIANYKIDKKRIADWEEKNKQIEQFTDSTNDH